jgi:hypothetical protein
VLSELYQRLYDFELTQREHFLAAVNIPIVAITVLAGSLATMVMSFNYEATGIAIWFSGVAVLALIGLGFAIICVFKSILGYEYERTTSPKIWADYADTLRRHYAQMPNGPDIAHEKLVEAFNERLNQAIEFNKQNNRRRGKWLYLANLSCAIVLARSCLWLLPMFFRPQGPRKCSSFG